MERVVPERNGNARVKRERGTMQGAARRDDSCSIAPPVEMPRRIPDIRPP